MCWLAENSAKYQRAWGLEVTAPERAPQETPCVHLGEATGEKVPCPTCNGGKVLLKAFACAVHGSCTVAKRAPDVACCVGCPDKSTGNSLSAPLFR